MALLTIFTPSYNRSHTLSRVYKSLCHQTCMDFLWLIVDDGSTDGTAACVRRWKQSDPFRYNISIKKTVVCIQPTIQPMPTSTLN